MSSLQIFLEMSKQQPKQRTLEFFMKKPTTQGPQGTQGTSNGAVNKPSGTGKMSSTAPAKPAKTSNAPPSDVSAKGKPPVGGIATQAKAAKTSPREDESSSPLMGFPSSRSIPSDVRSMSSGHSVRSASRASTPPATDVDMVVDDDEEAVVYQPVCLLEF